ncbi:hypothetical protein FOZ60_002902 [Perkinsus olseni]|uniref:Uncharacterized protein n=1 Tax=Perkinsus olseni TaxID=32597 RepID=A0A7J6NWW2_PEROL|nr:hypothetical protein FOZ60_002902 [Perkinsus olseni]
MGTMKGGGPKVADQLEPSTVAGVTLALCGTVCTAINGINMKKVWRNDREISKSMIFSVSRTVAACMFFPVWLFRDAPKIRDGSIGNPFDARTALALALYSVVMVTQHLSSLSVLHVLSPSKKKDEYSSVTTDEDSTAAGVDMETMASRRNQPSPDKEGRQSGTPVGAIGPDRVANLQWYPRNLCCA